MVLAQITLSLNVLKKKKMEAPLGGLPSFINNQRKIAAMPFMIHDATIGGDSIQDKVVSADELLELVRKEVPDWSPDPSNKGKEVIFSLDKNRVKPDRYNPGNEKHSLGIHLSPRIHGEINGRSVDITWFNRRMRVRKDGDWTHDFQPQRVLFGGRSVVTYHKSDAEKMLFFALHHYCSSSPVKPSNGRKTYGVRNVVAENQTKVDNAAVFVETYRLITDPEADIELLRNKLAGMTNNASVDTLLPSEVRGHLIDQVNLDPARFIKKWNDVSNTFDGLLMRAIGSGVIVRRNKNSSEKMFVWNREASSKLFNSDREELVVSYLSGSGDGMRELRKWLSDDTTRIEQVRDALAGNYEDAVIGKMSEDIFKVKQPASNNTFNAKEASVEHLVLKGLDLKMIILSKEGSSVSLHWGAKGEVGEKLLDLKGTNTTQEVVEFFEDNEKLCSTLRRKVGAKLLK
jgi:hypothetical protein